MSEEEFIKETIEVLRILDSNPKYYVFDRDKLFRINRYIKDNENSQTVKNFIEALLRLYTKAFKDQKLKKAFTITDNLPFLKQMEIFRNLPHFKYSCYQSCIGEIIEMPSDVFWNMYKSYPWALKKYKPDEGYDKDFMDYIQKMIDFMDNNYSLVHGGISDYHSVEEEIKIYENALRNYDDNQRFKSMGNLGELYIMEYLEFIHLKPCLVAREIKDGFGYDIYLVDKDNNEILIEVKTTMYERSEDSFEISENEYRVLKSTLDNPKAKYFIFRFKLDDLRHGNFRALMTVDENTLVDYQNPNHQYKFLKGANNKLYFMEGPQAPQVLKK